MVSLLLLTPRSLIIPLYARHEVFATTEEITTQPVNEAYTEASADIYQEPMTPIPEVFTEIYTETYTDVYTEKYTEVITGSPEIFTETFTDIYTVPPEMYTEVFTDLYEDVYQNEYRDQAATERTEGGGNVTPPNTETTEKRDEKDAGNQNDPDPIKGIGRFTADFF